MSRESDALRECIWHELAERSLTRMQLTKLIGFRGFGETSHAHSGYDLLCGWLEGEPISGREELERQVRTWLLTDRGSVVCVGVDTLPGPLDIRHVHKQLEALLAGDVRARVVLTDRGEHYFAQKGDHHGSHA